MAEENPLRPELERFIQDQIDSVPHLEALLLLWNTRPRRWSSDELGHYLYVPDDRAHQIVRDLAQRDLVVLESETCFYQADEDRDTLIAELDRTWRRQLVRISNMIHSKASPAVRDFARAFLFKKDKP